MSSRSRRPCASAGPGVDHERPGRTDDDADADVPLAVAGHEAAVGDLDEALVPRG